MRVRYIQYYKSLKLSKYNVNVIHFYYKRIVEFRFRSQNFRSDVEEKIRASLLVMEGEMKRVYEIGGLPHIQDIQEEVSGPPYACDV